MARWIKNIFLVVLVVLAVSIAVVFFWLPGRYVVPIIMYHQVTHTDDFKPNWVSPEHFDRQMSYLKDHRYQVIPLEKLVEGTLAGKSFPRKTVVITFDDGYENNYTNAFPILKKYGFPATIFVPADKVGEKGRLTWAQMKKMRDFDIDIGSHTRSEAYLPDLSIEQQQWEIVLSKRILEDGLGAPVDHFAYTIGGFNEGIKNIVKKAGYKAACATNRGYDRFNKDVYELNRVRFSDRDIRKDYLWIKLSGYYNLFRKLKNPD